VEAKRSTNSSDYSLWYGLRKIFREALENEKWVNQVVLRAMPAGSRAPFQSFGGSGGTPKNCLSLKENDMTFRPLHDRVLVRRIEADERTAGGIIIPDTAKEKPQQGEVVAVGPGARDEAGKLVELDVKVGNRILFGKWSGTEIKIDGEDLLIMKESDVLGVIENAGTLKKAA
jgi:chaperonin GroES